MGRLSVLPASIVSEKEKMGEETSISSSTDNPGDILIHVLNQWPIFNPQLFLQVLYNAFKQLTCHPTDILSFLISSLHISIDFNTTI